MAKRKKMSHLHSCQIAPFYPSIGVALSLSRSSTELHVLAGRGQLYFQWFTFKLKLVPGGQNLIVDALSQLPQYHSPREEVVQSIIAPPWEEDQGSLQYLVRWKGYSELESSWVKNRDMNGDRLKHHFHRQYPDRLGGACEPLYASNHIVSCFPGRFPNFGSLK
ncbi:hypothetical protein E2320_011017 [Naja naja]|nr:hypothetical protein E2320_011017 [Naja naja]